MCALSSAPSSLQEDEIAALKAQLQAQGFPHFDIFGNFGVSDASVHQSQDRDAEIARLKELLPAGSAAAVAHASAWRATSPDV